MKVENAIALGLQIGLAIAMLLFMRRAEAVNRDTRQQLLDYFSMHSGSCVTYR